MNPSSNRVREWAALGRYTRWTSTAPENAGRPDVAVYLQERGAVGAPAVVFVHGYPTSSHDFHRVASLLEADHRLYFVDLPGYGLSDKPRNGYRYTIADDARLVDHLIRDEFGLDALTLVTHDRGDSVGLALLELREHGGQQSGTTYGIRQQVVLNGNVFLPLAQLTRTQKALLSTRTGPVLSRLLPPRVMARGLARATCTPTLDAEETAAIEGMLAHQDGMRVQHALSQYLDERRRHETGWLEAPGAARSRDRARAGGELDTIAPTRVADFVWADHLRGRTAPATYWRVPAGNHYVQLDQPAVVADLVRRPVVEGAGTVDGATLVGTNPA